MTASGETLSVPRAPAKLPSPFDLPTFIIVHCQSWFVEFTTDALASRLMASRI
jgi:deazaflavin-dependent oxidoreductase (nitroreductase family)